MRFEWHPKTPLEFVIFFVLLWCTVSFVLATIGGWRRLAEAYRFEGTFEGSQWRFTSARIRWGVNYNGCLTIGANERGLYVAVLLPFRLAHPPLFIPWSDVGVTEQRGLVFRYLEFGFLKAPGVPFRVRHQLGSSLLEAGGWEADGLREKMIT